MALTDCSITSQTFTKTGGAAIGSANAQLIISPNQGYVVSSSSFTDLTGAPITGILSVSLSDSGTPGTLGNTVVVDVDLDDSYVMPSANTTLSINIDGKAAFVGYSVSGTYTTNETNTTTSPVTDVPYSDTGFYNTTATLFTKTFTAATGYYFENAPTGYVSSGNTTVYTFEYSDTFDSNGYLTAREFTVKYTFPPYSISNNHLVFNANAVALPAVLNEEVRGYSINTSNVNRAGETRILKIYGIPNADWTLLVQDSSLSTVLNTSGKIPAAGYYAASVTLPAASSDVYTFTLGGDLVSPFPQSNPFTLTQAGKTSIDFTPTSALLTITPTSIVKTATINSIPAAKTSSNIFTAYFKISSSNPLEFDNTIDGSSWDLPGSLNGYDFTILSSKAYYTNILDNTEITLVAEIKINQYGTSDISIGLDIDNFISENTSSGSDVSLSVTVPTGYTSGLPVPGYITIGTTTATSVNCTVTGDFNESNPEDITLTLDDTGSGFDLTSTSIVPYDVVYIDSSTQIAMYTIEVTPSDGTVDGDESGVFEITNISF